MAEANIPPSVLAGVLDIGQRAGHDVARWFSGTGVDPTLIVTSESAKVSFRQATTILRRALQAMPGLPIGMQVGGRDMLLTFGLLWVAMRASTTVADAMHLGLELHQASGSLVDLEAETFSSEFALRLYERFPEPQLVAFLCEEVYCSTLVFVRSVLGADKSPSYVELTYPQPRYSREYQRFFRCPLQFDADANRMVFPLALLNKPLPSQHQPTRAVAVEACRRLLETGGGRRDTVTSVETLLGANIRRPLTMMEVAVQLNVTERTLRRQLVAAGESFAGIRDRTRERRAALLLTESTLTISAIAREVGFSDPREFRRAYRRWTGQPPSAQRAK